MTASVLEARVRFARPGQNHTAFTLDVEIRVGAGITILFGPSPRAVLLDEPLKGLDTELRSSIVDDLRAWNRANRLPILYVTHQRDEVNALGERVIAIDRGRVVSEGIPHAVLDAPRTKRLAHAAGFENYLTAAVLELREADGVMRAGLTG